MKARVLSLIRQTPLYLGVFIAPAILFFAFTWALQTLSLHEASPYGSYQPAKWIVVLGEIHKKQTPVIPSRKGQLPASSQPGRSTSLSSKTIAWVYLPSGPLTNRFRLRCFSLPYLRGYSPQLSQGSTCHISTACATSSPQACCFAAL